MLFDFKLFVFEIYLNKALFELTANALFTIADVGRNPIALTCNAAANESLIWVETLDRQNLFFVTLNNRTYANGTNLTFQTIILGDEGYYGCGVTNSAGVFRMIQTFFLYVRGLNIDFYFLFYKLNSQ